MGEKCGYTCTLSEWQRAEGEPETWECHRVETSDAEACAFHSTNDAVSDQDKAEAFRALVRGEDTEAVENRLGLDLEVVPEDDESSIEAARREKQFIDAEFGDLNIANEVINDDNSHPIDLRGATIDDFDASHAYIEHEIRLAGSTVQGEFNFEEADIREEIKSKERTVKQGSLKVGGYASFKWADVRSALSFEGATFENGIGFQHATVDHGIWLEKANILGRAPGTERSKDDPDRPEDVSIDLEEAEVHDEVHLDEMTTEGSIWLKWALVGDAASFERTVVEGRIDFQYATIENGIWLRQATVDRLVDFHEATVRDDIGMEHARIGGPVSLKWAEVERAVSAERSIIDGQLSLPHATIGDGLWLDGATVCGRQRVSQDRTGRLDERRSAEGTSGRIPAENGADITRRIAVRFERTKVGERVALRSAVFRGGVVFNDARIDGSIVADGAIIEGEMSLLTDRSSTVGDGTRCRTFQLESTNDSAELTTGEVTTSIYGPIRLSNATVEQRVTIHSNVLFHAAIRAVDASNAELIGSRNELQVGENSENEVPGLVYDLADATIGSLNENPETDEYFYYVHFFDTVFENFRFDKYTNQLKSIDWEIHKVKDQGWDIQLVSRVRMRPNDSSDEITIEEFIRKLPNELPEATDSRNSDSARAVFELAQDEASTGVQRSRNHRILGKICPGLARIYESYTSTLDNENWLLERYRRSKKTTDPLETLVDSDTDLARHVACRDPMLPRERDRNRTRLEQALARLEKEWSPKSVIKELGAALDECDTEGTVRVSDVVRAIEANDELRAVMTGPEGTDEVTDVRNLVRQEIYRFGYQVATTPITADLASGEIDRLSSVAEARQWVEAFLAEGERHHDAGRHWSDRSLPETMSQTYQLAKNGAEATGNASAAGNFFRLEKKYIRFVYCNQILERNGIARLRALKNLLSNQIFRFTGYGEKPHYVLGLAIILVGLGSLFFRIADSLTRKAVFARTPPYGHPVGYLIVSLESFVTLVLGGSAELQHRWVRLIAQIEGFMGVFLIAFFVFALTRSIHR